MKTVSILFVFGLFCSLTLMGFQCASPEMTSAKLYMQRSEWADAERSLMLEVEKKPNSAEAWYLLGRVRLEQKNYSGMDEAFKRSLAVGNQYANEIRMLRLSTWGRLFNAGVDAFNEAKQQEGEDSDELYAAAIEHFSNAIIANPDSAATYINLGYAYIAQRDYDTGLHNLKIGLSKQKDPELALAIGAQHYERARRYRQSAQDASGEEKASLEARASKHFDEAIKVLVDARSWAPDDAKITGLLLDAYIAAGRTEEALINIKEAVERNPRNAVYRYDYGVLLIRAGDHEGAIKQFEAAVEINPQFEDALYNLGVAYLQLGAKMRVEAEAKARAAGRDAPVDRSYEEKFRQGQRALESLRLLNPEGPDVWEALGQAYANLNMQKEAEEAFRKADDLRRSQ